MTDLGRQFSDIKVGSENRSTDRLEENYIVLGQVICLLLAKLVSMTDIDRQFSDIMSIKAGNKICSMDGQEESYSVGSR